MLRYVKSEKTIVSECVYFRLPFRSILQLLRRAAPLFLLGFAVPSVALTLGQPQGAVWIGRPLDLVVPLTLAEGEGGDSLCAEAELVQGGTRVDDRRVTVSLEPGSRPGQTRIRIRSTMPVDEPVVQVTVRAGCQASSSRQFVLLSDMPTEVATTPALPSSAGASGATSSGSNDAAAALSNRQAMRATGEGSGSAGANAAAPTAPPRRATPPRPRITASAEGGEPRRPAARATTPPVRRSTAAAPAAAKPPTPAASAPAATPAPSSASAPSANSGPRLQLDLLDPSAVRNPALAASAAANPTAVDSAVSASLAAASAAANAEELQRASERMKALEATLATLRDQSAQNQRLLLEMRTELAEARDSRYRNPLVYALCVLLLLALIALFMLWRVARRTANAAWWGDAAGRDDGGFVSSSSAASSAGAVDASLAGVSAAPKTGPFGTALVEPAAEEAPETLPPMAEDDSAPARYVNTEELFDVQQQSDFFVSLGQHEQAIAVLSEHIADNPETSALAYLDLLRIFHTLDRRDDYARVGQEFERAFNASVPDFEQFSELGRGLEHYGSALARIEAQWPRPGTLNLIEELVFRKPGARDDESFDLAAYRELLLLYSVAKEVIDPNSAPPTPITPLSFLDTHDATLESTRPADLDRTTELVGLTNNDHNAPDAPLPSLYGAIDDRLSHDTVIAAHLDAAGPAAAPEVPAMIPPSVNMSYEEEWTRPMPVSEPSQRVDAEGGIPFDHTAIETLETLPAELELEPRPSGPSSTDDMPLPELKLDLELFDPAIEAEIAPRPRRRR